MGKLFDWTQYVLPNPEGTIKYLESLRSDVFIPYAQVRMEANRMAGTGVVRFVEMQGDEETDNCLMYVEKTVLGGDVNVKYSATEQQQLWGDTYIAFQLNEAGVANTQEMMGDEDSNHFYLSVPKASIGPAQVGTNYQAFSYVRSGGQILLVIVPEEE